ncbi:dihydrolipoamide acetyltransferase family protein [Candidatus Clavichlamydia salmonicola]|uniref:dihydrolipoamide acetyltransferase family protein n=1 Tax=Candidatus Clavichlamydia salmonicola TaxID=469812 RepID=UPI001890FCCA|nr:dihydrolipoamide acetyltransferase family protein [Candidatus Clavichlamydia salmonicola]
MNISNIFELRFPKIGETSSGGLIIQWLKKEGESVLVDEALLEVSTDKVVTEISSPVSGVLHAILIPVGEEAEPNSLLATILLSAKNEEKESVVEKVKKNIIVDIEEIVQQGEPSSFLSPVVMEFANVNGINLETLQKIPGTGNQGRVTKKDVQNFLNQKLIQKTCSQKGLANREEETPISGRRLLLANEFSKSLTIPTVYLISEMNLSSLMQKIQENKNDFYNVHGIKLTPTAFFFKAVAQAIQAFPLLNAEWKKQSIIVKKQINIGFAVDLDYQGIILPVIKDCGNKSIMMLIKEIFRLGNAAKNQTIDREDLVGATLSVTNVGIGGACIGLPLVSEGQALMVAVGSIKNKVYINQSKEIVVGEMLSITAAFDHRVVDGLYVSHFLKVIQKYLEEEAFQDSIFI